MNFLKSTRKEMNSDLNNKTLTVTAAFDSNKTNEPTYKKTNRKKQKKDLNKFLDRKIVLLKISKINDNCC